MVQVYMENYSYFDMTMPDTLKKVEPFKTVRRRG